MEIEENTVVKQLDRERKKRPPKINIINNTSLEGEDEDHKGDNLSLLDEHLESPHR